MPSTLARFPRAGQVRTDALRGEARHLRSACRLLDLDARGSKGSDASRNDGHAT
ncbi:hypothetical protein [Salinicola tamaricis]|uniref:hypothetical protein n=1 Tax=Salinicola tamaricis TaxID=1771309 RepID=UPI0013EAD753|nr:hypothetical protein [Salinicola tamaricis]